MKFICVQPKTIYYLWQLEVMINNFLEMGVNAEDMQILLGINDNILNDKEITEQYDRLKNHFTKVNFYEYRDLRKSTYYVSSLRPNLLKQHYQRFPELNKEVIMYHDCDIIFTKPINEWISKGMINNNSWYGSDTRWYIGHNYILSKGQDVLDKMCEIVGISKDIVKENELNSIGAHYLIKNIDSAFWEKVENDSEKLFKEINELSNLKKESNPKYHELQIWCADMWAVLWNGWLRGNKTICHSNFNFSWGTSVESEYKKCNIMHNAGVTEREIDLFYKANYINKLPYTENLNIKENTGSWYYWQEIKKTNKKTCLEVIRKLPIEFINKRKKYILFKNDCGVSDVARQGGIYEKYIFDYINKNIKVKNTNIIDIGANFGFHSLEFADLVGPKGKVYAFEPQRLVYNQLCGNSILNGYNNIYCYNIALNSVNLEEIDLENPDYFSEDTINIGNIHTNAYTSNNKETISTKMLDDYKFNNVSIMKIDAQGFEPCILKGAIKTIQNNRPYIFIEVEPPQLSIYGFTPDNVFELLHDMNYKIQKLHPDNHIVDYVAIPN